MLYNTQNCWVSGLFPSSGILDNSTFRKPDLFPSSSEGEVSETSCFLEYQTMEKVQKPSNFPEYYISEFVHDEW
jgi:hypothetical protein